MSLLTMTADLNLIYYGPPGTGKTFATAQRAVEIIEGSAPKDRAELMARYAALRNEGLIEFVTFHQSYSYEEFVEGIRPVLEEDKEATEEGAVRYECRDGLFRRFCAGSKAGARKSTSYAFDPEKHQVWKMSLGNTRKPEDDAIYDECLEKGYILLGYGRGLDFTGCDTRDQVFQRLKKDKPEIEAIDYNVTAIHAFKNEMEVGDLVVISHGNHRFRAIARVTGPYQRLRKAEYGQTRTVEWLFESDESLPRENIINRRFSQATIYKLKPSVLYIDKLRALLATDKRSSNRVLIIDEINRGNIAKILGELITLLEPDKRRGAINEATVKLPYSDEEFAVPGNVYIIGTMNTADRSIALLDTALRRRFRFIEVEPDPDVIRREVGQHGVLAGIDVARLLELLNDRIELLHDRDHRLGHSYFLRISNLDELRDVMTRAVIPLLQEYFHDHWERICLVLGCQHDEAGKPMANTYPIIRVRVLRASDLLGAKAELEDKLRYEMNPDFANSSGAALRPFFEGILRTTKPSAQAAAGPG
jgi:5-methylcytosine-specific restriction protein B